MPKKANSQAVELPLTRNTNTEPAISAEGEKTNLETCLKVLSNIQDQIRFADTKAAFVFGINTLMFGFISGSLTQLKRSFGMAPVPPSAWVGLVTLILFCICFVSSVGILIFAVMSRFGALAPKSRFFFGHIAWAYGKDYSKYVNEVRGMSEDDWLCEIGTQIVETSHIALTKHSAARTAAMITLAGLTCWVVGVFSIALIPSV